MIFNRILSFVMIALFCFTSSQTVWAVDSVRDQEIAQCLSGEISTWGDGSDRSVAGTPLVFKYQHDSAPAWFTRATVLSAIQKSVTSWARCGLSLSVAADAGSPAVSGTVVRVLWSDAGSRNNFGLANLGDKTLSLGPAAFQMLKTRNPSYDASQTLQMVISHEMGHFMGVMSHSRRCVDVTSYYNDGKGQTCYTRGGGTMPTGVEYRSSLPTACDIQRCRLVNHFANP